MGCNGSKASAPASKATAVTPEGDFKVLIERTAEGDSYGLTIIGRDDNTIAVQKVLEEGLVPSWNQKNENSSEVQIKDGDVIVAVNGVFGDVDAMKKELATMAATLAIKRPVVESPAAAIDAGADTAPVATAEEPAAEPAVATTLDVPAEPAPPTVPAGELEKGAVAAIDESAVADALLVDEANVEVTVAVEADDEATDARLCKLSMC